jgi:cation diffusion facilitator CzcD-associated flavoprotein CzcO
MLNSNPIHVGLSQNFVFHTTYLSSEWDAASQTHTLTLQPASGPSYTHITDILISANGPLCAPLLPPIPGVSSFRGTAFHNLHWRKHQPDLVNKKVAVIGNGSSGIQLLPGVAKTPGAEVVQYVRSGGYYFGRRRFTDGSRARVGTTDTSCSRDTTTVGRLATRSRRTDMTRRSRCCWII